MTREVRDLDRDATLLLEPFHGSFDPATDKATACALLVDHLAMRRNKRCLLAYHRTRTDKLEELVWKGTDLVDLSAQQMRDVTNDSSAGTGYAAAAAAGAANAAAGAAGDSGLASEASGASSSLSPHEEDYVRQYSDLLAAYKGHWTDIDLTGSLEPPRDLFIDVRVLKDAGEIQTEYGCVLKSNSRDGRKPWHPLFTDILAPFCRSITLSRNSQFYVRQGDVERLIAQGYLQKLG